MRKVFLILGVSLLITGCGSEPEVKKAEPTKPLTKTEELKRKAKLTEAASIVGYDGKAIHKNLDKIIDENAKHQKMLEDVGDL